MRGSRTALVRSEGAELDVERAAAILAACKDVDQVKDLRDRASAVQVWLRHQRASLHAQLDAAEIALRAERRLGQLLATTPKATGNRAKPGGNKLSPPDVPTLAERGIEKRDASRWQRLASVPEERFEQHVSSVRTRGQRLTTSGTIAATSHVEGYNSDEYYTPIEYLEAARAVMGGIDLDPASCEAAQERVMASEFWTATDNALASHRHWAGRVWMNPPYSQPLANQFVAKLISSFGDDDVEQAVCLMNASTDTTWFHDLARSSAAMCLTKGRIGFVGADGRPAEGNRVGQVFFYLGVHAERFLEVFAQFGLAIDLRGVG